MHLIQVSSRLEGKLDVPLWKRAWQRIMERHSILRTVFMWEQPEKPLQNVLQETALPWREEDWRRLSKEQQMRQLGDYFRDEQRRGFDPAEAPLQRLALFRLRDDQYQFVWSASLLCLDRESIEVVYQDVFRHYRAWREGGGEPEFPAAPGYRDFIAWLRSQDKAEEAAFWRSALSGFTPAALPPIRERGNESGGSPQYRSISDKLDRTIAGQLQAAAAQHGLALNTIVQGAWAWLLSCREGSRDVVFGVTSTVRPATLPGADAMAGVFTATVPLRVPVDPGRSLIDWLHAIEERGRQTQKYPYSSQEEISRWSGLPPAETLFATNVMFENRVTRTEVRISDDLRVAYHQVFPGLPYPVTLFVETDEELWLRLEFDERRFSAGAMGCLMTQYKDILGQMAENCVRTLSDIDLVSIADEEEIEDIYSLSPLQQGMLFHSLYDSGIGTGVYFVQIGCELHGALQVENFKHAWERVISRHKILRTEFLWDSLEEPVQIVRKKVDIVWQQEDWRHYSAQAQDEKWRAFLKQDWQRGFDMKRAPLMRFALFQAGGESFRFVWSSHHILMDGWCASILLAEALSGYTALCKREELQLEEPRPYRDYIRWLRRQDEKAAEAFWREELKGFGAPTRLRLEEARELPPGAEPYGETALAASSEVVKKLEELARLSRVTLNTVVQGAWAFLLSCYSGERDVVFGAVAAGRSAPVKGIEGIVGLFINSVPARVQVQPEETLSSYLKRVQNMQVRARQFEHCPLIRVQAWSEIPRGAALFDSIVIFENTPVDSRLDGFLGSGMKLARFDFFERTNYPLSLRIAPGAEMLMTLMYDRRLFAEPGVERQLVHLRAVLSAMSAGPETPVDQLSLLSEEERRQVVEEWNRTAQPYPTDQCLHDLFVQRAEMSPEATALEYKGQRLTYGELNGRSNQFAHYLRGLGVRSETIVAVCLERSDELVMAVLGILKAGAAYVPCDLAYPAEYIRHMLEDSRAGFVLTRRALLPLVPASEAAVILLDEQHSRIDEQSVDGLPPLAFPENLAYVFYTSGSTGTPKGIAGSHRGMVNRTAWAAGVYPMEKDDVCCQKTAFSFIDSIGEMFSPILSGVPLKIVPEETARDAGALIRFLQAEEVTRIILAPSLLRVMLGAEFAAADTLAKLRVVIGSGEAMPPELANLARQSLPHAALLNFYGCTELASDATWADLSNRQDSDPVLIGRPVTNARAYVLDDDLHPVAIGVIGELYVGGDGLARGYYNRPELTAERFIPDPFSAVGGERLYRIGDLARWRADGNLEYLGRKDYQVKVRGQRIELGQIEATLSAHPSVEQAAVIAQSDSQETRIVAYVTLRQKTTIEALREGLRQKLPEYMVPAAFVILEAMPLTPNGKLNRRALPAPDNISQERHYVAPRTPMEHLLARIWSEILRLDRVGIEDNFLEIGGHSLQATRVAARLRSAIKLDVPLPVFFKAATIAKLAEAIERLKEKELVDGAAVSLPQIERADRDAVVVLVDED